MGWVGLGWVKIGSVGLHWVALGCVGWPEVILGAVGCRRGGGKPKDAGGWEFPPCSRGNTR